MLHPSKKLVRLAWRLIREDGGVAAIEFGFIAMILVVLLVGGTDLGLAMRHRSQLESAVRAGLQEALNEEAVALEDVEAAALAASGLPSSPAATASASRSCRCPDGTDVDCDTSNACGAVAREQFVTLTLTQDHRWLLGVPWLDNPMTLSMTRTLQVE
jgi:Flp pilus assembly protein TadG